ncbi:hypothetical protein PTTG_29505 [Puccinia triticina 1-1 BBBD Race 1]|uniref:Uncharacterized protein n=1 Tax=Puccinia triticina (isolate 1-1 / race 1 (BBBD)) TaxID=630390 RepID=A0A180G3K6_PUCT1|nr:hypothetical protein PTTG_29505 [Puccinia triticina 1-1 BBBD Race 1]
MRFLNLPAAGAQLKSIQELDEAWQNNKSHEEHPFSGKPKGSSGAKGKQKREDSITEATSAEKPVKRTHQTNTSGGGGSSAGRGTKAPQSGSSTEAESQAVPLSGLGSSSTHSYALQVRKKSLYHSFEEEETTELDEDAGSGDTVIAQRIQAILPVDAPDCPRLLPEELDVVRRTILHTILPSWIDRVPPNLGAAIHGSLKAAEWLILYKVYYTIALIPLWVQSHKVAASTTTRRRISFLLESTTTLSQVAHFLTLPEISVQNLGELDDLDHHNGLILKYQRCLQDGWPSKSSKPNLHLTQHFSEVIRRFGPPRLTAAWAQERVNGMLQRLPTNHQIDELPKTLINKWHINSTLCSMQNDTTYQTGAAEELELRGSPSTFVLEPPLFQKWKRAVARRDGTRPTATTGHADRILDFTVEIVPSFQADRKTFTRNQHHQGNSFVKFYLGKDQRFGESFEEAQRSEDPHGDYPDLNCRLVKAKFDGTTVIASDCIIGHVAGTFGFAVETISAVGLRTAGWEGLADD